MNMLKQINKFLDKNINKVIFLIIIIMLFFICKKQIIGYVKLNNYYYNTNKLTQVTKN